MGAGSLHSAALPALPVLDSGQGEQCGASSTAQGQCDFSVGAHSWERASELWGGFRTNVWA